MYVICNSANTDKEERKKKNLINLTRVKLRTADKFDGDILEEFPHGMNSRRRKRGKKKRKSTKYVIFSL